MRLLLDPLKKILDFIVYSNLFIALCVAFATLQTALVFSTQSENIFTFILPNFIATFVLYNLQRLYYSAKQPNNAKYNWYNKNRRLIFTLMMLTVFCSFNLLWDFFFENLYVLIAYGILAVISLFYFLPPLQLRQYGLIKPFIISFVFICTTILLPLLNSFNLAVWLYAFGQFCFITALCILFDIRDVEHDKTSNFITLPIKYGLTKAKYISIFLLLVYLASAIFSLQSTYFIAAIITASVAVLLTVIAKPSRHNYFYVFLVDGCIIFQCVLVLVNNRL
jgi:4-hydroxybenzoate polyprenyltransferase